ncbi:uncharacterized protein LOC130809749 isoform X2 [Amaranthus tricolor]|uniref:uncharacterized protein LOC130809749 isoform X2 n=1 Tax=Amaranthus tricolor TaxID=29722 RepID=UPI002585C02E|nr:uncharacterized protein LOC130809749 isoform X2 [Amaranthus tricolor]
MSTDNNAPQPMSNGFKNAASQDLKGEGSSNNSEEQKELHVRAMVQEQEISHLKWKISQAYIKELQLLKEKYALERRFSDLRMAMDEKERESVNSALKELAHRKDDLEQNVRLTTDLQDVEEQRCIFTTSLLGLLAEHRMWPSVRNASSISMSVKHLYDQLHQKIQEKTRELRVLSRDQCYENNQPSSVIFPSPYQPQKEYPSLSSQHTNDDHSPSINNVWPEEQNNDTGNMVLYDEGPGIQGFQITGEAKLGGKLLGCGYPVRGTSLCMFQWVRHLQDGTRDYIEGATNPEYVVTADDVDKCIAVECIPMDENGRQGEIVRHFANEQKKISCDPDMQAEIDSYISKGQANFSVLVLLLDPFEHWEEATFILRHSGFQVKINKTETIQISAKFSENLSIKIPGGLSSQFVLICSDGTSHPFRCAYNDVQMRDTLVLTIRMFQSKALDDRRKGKGQM